MSEDIPTVSYFYGEKIEDLSREKLLECVRFLAEENKNLRERHESYNRIMEFRTGRLPDANGVRLV